MASRKKRKGSPAGRHGSRTKSNAPVSGRHATLQSKQAEVQKTTHVFSPLLLLHILLGAVFVMILISRMKYLPIPFDRDEGAYGYLGWMALSGGVPYVDFYEMKPPLLFYSYALIIAIFGKTTTGLHLAATLINITCAWFVYRLGQELWKSREAAAIAGIVFFVFGSHFFLTGYAMQAEYIILVFALPGLLRTQQGASNGNRINLFFGGILLACSALVKQNGIFFCAAGLLIVLIYALRPLTWIRKQTVLGVLSFAAGGILPVVACILFLMFTGSLDEFWYWIYEHPQKYLSNLELGSSQLLLRRAINGILFGHSHWVVPGVLGVLLFPFCGSIQWRNRAVILGLFLLSLCTVLPGMRFYGHYWLCVIPAFALMVPAVYEGISYFIKNAKWKKISHLLVVLALVFISAFHFNINWNRYYHPDFQRILTLAHSGNYFYNHKQIGDLLKAEMTPGDGLIVFGSEPQIYLYADRKAPTRHFYTSFTSKEIPEAHAWEQEVINDVKREKPEYFVFIVEPFAWMFKEHSPRTLFNWAYGEMQRNYTTIACVELNPNGASTIIRGPGAQNCQPESQKYVIISKRNQ